MKKEGGQFEFYKRKLLSLLRVRSAAAGLEISDQALRLVSFDGREWNMAAVRLEPGIMARGMIKDEEAFISALIALKGKLLGPSALKKKMNVVVALSSVEIYSQVFTLPIMEEGEDLDKAIELNVQMLSPLDANQVYSSYEMLGRDADGIRFEVAASFVDRSIVDAMVQALFRAGFISVGIESRSLALARVIRGKRSGVDISKPYLLLDIDNTGIDFLIVRKGHSYFEYANPWYDLANDKGEIPEDKFEETLRTSLRQVTNFYEQHWPEPLGGVILSTAAFEEVAERVVGTVISLPITPLAPAMNQEVSPQWFVALGSGLRGFETTGRDREINLLGEGAEETYHREQLVSFMNFWRVLVPVALGLLVLTFGLADGFLASTRASIGTQSVNLGPSETAQVAALQASSTEFNQSVALIAGVEQSLHPKNGVIAAIMQSAASSSVVVTHISLQGPNTSLLVNGTAQTEDEIIAFKTAIETSGKFGTVDLPLSGITGEPGSFTFSMSFPEVVSAF